MVSPVISPSWVWILDFLEQRCHGSWRKNSSVAPKLEHCSCHECSSREVTKVLYKAKFVKNVALWMSSRPLEAFEMNWFCPLDMYRGWHHQGGEAGHCWMPKNVPSVSRECLFWFDPNLSASSACRSWKTKLTSLSRQQLILTFWTGQSSRGLQCSWCWTVES